METLKPAYQLQIRREDLFTEDGQHKLGNRRKISPTFSGVSVTPLIYVLHCSGLYGTERMAMETLEGFKDQYTPVILCPPGPLVKEAEARGVRVLTYQSVPNLIRIYFRLLKEFPSLVLMTTAISHAYSFAPLNLFFRRKTAHLHLVHGGAVDKLSYGRKKFLNGLNLVQVGVSSFVRKKLLQHGVRDAQIRVVGNFLSQQTREGIRKRAPFEGEPLTKGLVISRVIPSKKVDLLFDATERHPDLNRLSFTIFGKGGMRTRLMERAVANDLNISLPGFAEDLNHQMADYDFLVHLCPEEPFGLVILEAMAAGLPVLVPDQGGSAGIITPGVTGFRFKANDADCLARELGKLTRHSAEKLNTVVASAEEALIQQFSCEAQVLEYQKIIAEMV